MIKYLGLLLFLSNTAWGKGNFGAGLIIGNPTGFSLNYFLESDISIDGALAFDIDDKFELYSTFLKRENGLTQLEGISLDLYYGIGFKYEKHDDKDDFYLGPRVPIGLSHTLNVAPVELALEVAGFYSLIEDVDFDLEIGLIGRYYF